MFNRTFFQNIPPVTKNILILNLIIWIFLAIVPESTADRTITLLGLHYVQSPDFKIWQILTYMFVQVEFLHLFFNMWAVLLFGYIIELSLGTRRFLAYYLLCGIGAAVIQEIVFVISIQHVISGMDPRLVNEVMTHGYAIMSEGMQYVNSQPATLCGLLFGTTIGASGAVFGILLAFAMLYPNREMYLFFIPYPIKAKWMVLGYGLLELGLGMGNFDDNVAHFAHLGGMLVGFILLYLWKKQAQRRRYDPF